MMNENVCERRMTHVKAVLLPRNNEVCMIIIGDIHLHNRVPVS